MNLKRIYIVIILYFLNDAQSAIERNLIRDYFKWKPVGRIIAFVCDSKTEMYDLAKFFIKDNFYTSVLDADYTEHNLSQILFTKHDHFGVIIDGNCDGSTFILNQSANAENFGDKYLWLIFSQNEKILDILRDLYINVNAEIIVAIPMSDQINWELLDVYNPGYRHGGSLKVNNVGTWNLTDSFNINKDMFILKYLRRKDMSGVTFKATQVLLNEFPGELLDFLYNNEGNRSIDNFNRFGFILWTHVKDFYNFTLDIHLLHVWGKELPNGSHIGMLGELQRKEIDIGICPVYYKEERIPVVDFITTTYIMKTSFIFRNPKPPLTIRGAFFTPLSNTVWVCTWAVMILVMLLIRVSFKQERIIERMQNDENYTEYDWSYIFLLIFGEICQQDVPRVPNLYSGRTLVFTSTVFTYMVYQFYSGGIVSSLLMEPASIINNLEDLMHSSLQIGIEDVVYEKDFFDQTSDQVALKLYRTKVVGKKNGSDAYYDIPTGLKMICQGGFAFQVDTNIAYEIISETYSNEVICDLGEVPLFPIQKMVGMCQQDSPFRELFTYGFLRLSESGIVHRQRIRWTTPTPGCINVVDSSKIELGMKEFFPVLLFYSVGMFISIFILFIEILITRKKRKICYK